MQTEPAIVAQHSSLFNELESSQESPKKLQQTRRSERYNQLRRLAINHQMIKHKSAFFMVTERQSLTQISANQQR
jgi:hypothetical protein